MNIFWLDQDLTLCAHYHCDKHVVKMILESAQLLSSVLYRIGRPAPYKETHRNHPCTLWAAKHRGNYRRLYNLMVELHKEYQFRYGSTKVHKSFLLLENGEIPHPDTLNDIEFGDFTEVSSPAPNCTSIKDIKDLPLNLVDIYRAYYILDKVNSIEVRYTHRNPPEWLGDDFKGNLFYKDICSKLDITPKTKASSIVKEKPKTQSKADLIRELPFNVEGLIKLKVGQLKELLLLDFTKIQQNANLPSGRLKAPYLEYLKVAGVSTDLTALTVKDLTGIIEYINKK